MVHNYLRIHFPSNSGRKLPKAEVLEAFVAEIKRARRCKGLRLPPIRMVAHQLSMSKTTIQEVYDELVDRGLVESRPRIGLFVRQAAESVGQRAASPVSAAFPPTLVPYPETLGHPRPKPSTSTIDLAAAFLDPDLVPRKQIEASLRAAVRSTGMGHAYHYLGLPSLRSCIATRLARFGISADPDHVVITVGSQHGLDIASRALARPVIAVEDPTYALGRQLFVMNRLQVVGLPLDPFRGVDLDRWQAILKKQRPAALHIVSSFQNPTGYSYSSHELEAILSFSRQFEFAIIEDDWGSEMLSHSEFRPSLRALGGDNVIYLNSFTKKILPSLRIGYFVGNSTSIGALVASKRASALGAPLLVEAALSEFLSEGYYDAHLERVHATLDERYRLTLQALRELMPDDVRWTTPGGGPFIWVELPSRWPAQALVDRMRAKGVNLTCSADSFGGAPTLNGVRLGYAYNPFPRTLIALERMASALSRPSSR